MEINLEFAKKMNKPVKGASGISLRSISGNRENCSMVIMADSYDDIRSAVVNYRMLTARGINASARGKSLEIRTETAVDGPICAVDTLFDFAQSLKFNAEDALDVFDFYRTVFFSGAYPEAKAIEIALGPEAFSLKVLLTVNDEAEAEEVIKSLSDLCTRYAVGIIKPIEF